MVEDIKLDTFPKEAGVYIFKTDDEVIYIGSSNNLYVRMSVHKTAIKQGSNYGHKQDLYQYLQSNPFAVEIQLTNDYRKLEQKLIEQHHPKYNAIRAYTGVAWNGNKAEYMKEYNKQFSEEKKQYSKQYYESNKEQKKQYYESHKQQIKQQMKQYYESNKEQMKQYYESNKEQKKQYQNKYNNQLCLYNGQTITLNALASHFRKQGITHPVLEAKKYLIKETETPIEFYDVYP